MPTTKGSKRPKTAKQRHRNQHYAGEPLRLAVEEVCREEFERFVGAPYATWAHRFEGWRRNYGRTTYDAEAGLKDAFDELARVARDSKTPDGRWITSGDFEKPVEEAFTMAGTAIDAWAKERGQIRDRNEKMDAEARETLAQLKSLSRNIAKKLVDADRLLTRLPALSVCGEYDQAFTRTSMSLYHLRAVLAQATEDSDLSDTHRRRDVDGRTTAALHTASRALADAEGARTTGEVHIARDVHQALRRWTGSGCSTPGAKGSWVDSGGAFCALRDSLFGIYGDGKSRHDGGIEPTVPQRSWRYAPGVLAHLDRGDLDHPKPPDRRRSVIRTLDTFDVFGRARNDAQKYDTRFHGMAFSLPFDDREMATITLLAGIWPYKDADQQLRNVAEIIREERKIVADIRGQIHGFNYGARVREMARFPGGPAAWEWHYSLMGELRSFGEGAEAEGNHQAAAAFNKALKLLRRSTERALAKLKTDPSDRARKHAARTLLRSREKAQERFDEARQLLAR